MALCLAASLIERDRFDPTDQMERYVRWRDEGYMSSTGACFDIGYTVHGALSRFVETGEPFAGSADPYSAGNGSLMRLAPVPMYFAYDATEAISKSADSSRTTHAAEEAVDACRYFGGLLVGALNAADKETLLSPPRAIARRKGLGMRAHWRPGLPRSRTGHSSTENLLRSGEQAMSWNHWRRRSGPSTGLGTFEKGPCWPPTWGMMPIPPRQYTGRLPAPTMESQEFPLSGGN